VGKNEKNIHPGIQLKSTPSYANGPTWIDTRHSC